MRPIHSLEDLRKAKQEVALQREITKRAFSKQLGVMKHDAGVYVLKKVVLPLGIGVVAAFGLKYFFGRKNEPDREAQRKNQEEVKELHTGQSRNSWLSYFSILLSLFFKIYQQIRAEKERNEANEAIRQNTPPPEKEPFTPKDFVRNYRSRSEASKEANN